MTTYRDEAGNLIRRAGTVSEVVEPGPGLQAWLDSQAIENAARSAAQAAILDAARPSFRRLRRLVDGVDPWPTTNAGWQIVAQDNAIVNVALGRITLSQLTEGGS